MPSVFNSALSGLQAQLFNDAKVDYGTYKFGQASVSFDGSAKSYLKSTETFTLGTLNWCLEMWVNLAATQPNATVRLAQISPDLPSEFGPGHLSIKAGGGLSVVAYDFSPSTPLISTSENLLGAGWKHVALSREGSTWRLFVDGVQVGTATWTDPVTGTNPWLFGGNSYSATGMTGWLDDIRFTLQQARYTAAFTPPSVELPASATSNDPYFANVSLLLDMEGTQGSTVVVDKSANVLAITAFGNAALSTAQKKFGESSAAFDGNGDYFTVANNPVLDISTGDFTIEAFVYLNVMPTTDSPSDWSNWMVIYERGTPNASDGWRFWIGQTALAFVIGETPICSGLHSMQIGVWYHLAVSREGNTFRLFVNGSQIQSSTSSAVLGSGSTYYIGTETAQGAYLNGYIDELRVTKGFCRYVTSFVAPTASFIPPIDSDQYYNNVSLRLTMDGGQGSMTFTDVSLNNLSATVVGNASLDQSIKKFGSASMYLDGVQDHLYYSSPLLAMGIEAFTMECWIYPTAAPQVGAVFGQGADNSGGINGNGINLYVQPSGIGAYIGSHSSSTWSVANVPITLNQWYHVALNRTLEGSMSLFINGIAYGTTLNGTNITEQRLQIGSFYIDNPLRNGFQFQGYIDDVRITKGFARYSANFTPPTKALPVILGAGTQDSDALFNDVKLLYSNNFYITRPAIFRGINYLSYSAYTPPTQVGLYRREADRQTPIRYQIGGNGRIYGTVKIKGVPNLPVSRRVRLFRELDGLCLAETWSNAVTGEYEFLGFDPTYRYTVLTYDYQQNFRAVVADNLIPEAVL
jgi:hypothetical protein